MYKSAASLGLLGEILNYKPTQYTLLSFVWNLGDIVTYVAAFVFAGAIASTLTGSKILEQEQPFSIASHGFGISCGIVGLFFVLGTLATNFNGVINLLYSQLEWNDISSRTWNQAIVQFLTSIITSGIGILLIIWGRRLLRDCINV